MIDTGTAIPRFERRALVRLDEMLPDELEERSPEVSNQY